LTAGIDLSTLFSITTLGIYIHAMFLSISLGFPLVICGLMIKYSRSGDPDYFRAAKTLAGVLALNFALGAVTGTLVEFGLVQAWPGSIFVIATFGLAPLVLELIAFVGEIVFLLWFVISLGKVKASYSASIMGLYFAFAALSGALITAVNSWLNAPWGTGSIASAIYPFLPTYGPASADPQALVKLKVALLDSLLSGGAPSQLIQNSTVARSIGLTLNDPFVALSSPYAGASILHNVMAGVIVGVSIALAGFACRYFRSGSSYHSKVIRVVLPIFLVLILIQPTLFGDMMGKAVVSYDPTKFALIEGASSSYSNPLVSFLAYGDPNHAIVGFDALRNATRSLGNLTVGQLASTVVPGLSAGAASNVSLAQVDLADLASAQANMGFVNAAYYAMIVAGILDVFSAVALASFAFRVPLLSRLAGLVFRPLGQRRTYLLLGLLAGSTSILASALGWAVREVGRKPWTVYGLIYPQEVVSPVAMNPVVMATFVGVFVSMAVVGIYGMYVFSTRPLKFLELLKRGAGEGS